MINSPTLSVHFDVHQGIDRWENEGGRIGYGTQVSDPPRNLPDASHWLRGIFNGDRETRNSLCLGAPPGVPLDQILECAGRRLKDLVGP